MISRFLKFFSLAILLLVFLSPVFSFGYTFSRNLKQGDSGDDVLALQKQLKVEPQSGYFGPITKKAVISFQESYRDDILVPAGLLAGTGFVGSLTRAKLSVISNTVTPPTASPTTPKTTTPQNSDTSSFVSKALKAFATTPQSSKKIIVSSLSNFIIKSGDTLFIKGAGFESLNSVHFGSSTVDNVISTTTKDVSVLVPSLTSGTYKVWVTTKSGASSEKTSSLFIKVSDVTKARPTISKVFPTQVKSTGTITVTGTGFDPQGNQINTNLGIIKNVSSSSGTTLTFKVADLPNISLFQSSFDVSTTVSFSISTTNGRTANYGYFTLTK